MRNTAKHYLSSALVGAFMLPATAGAQDNVIMPQEKILLQEGDALIFDDYQNPGNASFYLVMCPSYGAMRELYTTNPATAVTLLFNATHEDLAAMVEQHQELGDIFPDQQTGVANNGLILSNGSVDPAYTNNEFIGKISTQLNTSPSQLDGSKSDNPEMLQKMKNFSINFCFGTF